MKNRSAENMIMKNYQFLFDISNLPFKFATIDFTLFELGDIADSSFWPFVSDFVGRIFISNGFDKLREGIDIFFSIFYDGSIIISTIWLIYLHE